MLPSPRAILRRGGIGALAALAVAASACGKSDGSDCKAVAAHVAELLERDIERGGDAERLAEARLNLPPLRDALVQSCEDGEWSDAVRRCIVDAQSADELDACGPTAGAAAPAAAGAE